MIKVIFNVMGEGGEQESLALVELPAVPRAGERVVLSGDQFGDERTDETFFEVVDVFWRIFACENAEAHDRGLVGREVEVLLRLGEGSQPGYVGRCTCAPEKQATGYGEDPPDPGRCYSCGKRVVERRY